MQEHGPVGARGGGEEAGRQRITGCLDPRGVGVCNRIAEAGTLRQHRGPSALWSQESLRGHLSSLHLIFFTAELCNSISIPTTPPPKPQETLESASASRSPELKALLPKSTTIPSHRVPGLWERDGVHFTAEGSRKLGHRLAALLEPLVSRPRMPKAS